MGALGMQCNAYSLVYLFVNLLYLITWLTKLYHSLQAQGSNTARKINRKQSKILYCLLQQCPL